MCLSRPAWARGLKQLNQSSLQISCVAPRVGAWIETWAQEFARIQARSRPAWARGLKHDDAHNGLPARLSRPAWARGLKLAFYIARADGFVAPRVGAWIETAYSDC